MECTVCYDNVADIKLSKCGHSFCTGCAKEWFTRNEVATCPMCRGPFKFKGMKAWVDEKNDRDLCFEDAVNAILAERCVFSWIELDGVAYGKRISKIQKLAEFQLAYNKLAEYHYGDYEWYDEEELMDFALREDLSIFSEEERPVYFDDPVKPWCTRYPQIA